MPPVILTHPIICRMIARELLAILIQITLSPFSSSRSSVTSRVHCYFSCLLLFHIFLSFLFFHRAATVLRTVLPPARFRHDVSCAFVRVRAMYFIVVNHQLILSSRFFSAAPWLTTLGRHVRDLLPPLFTVSFFLPLLGIFIVLLSTSYKNVNV